MSGMAFDLFDYLNKHIDYDIYFIGSKQEEIEGATRHIQANYPNLQIKGFRNGYFKDQNERSHVLNEIISLNPNYVVIGMGSPIQEQFAIDLKAAGYNGIVFTCGGFFHQTKENINYYPNWINKYNLRAFYRLYREHGLFKRLYNVLVEFPILFTIDSVKAKIKI